MKRFVIVFQKSVGYFVLDTHNEIDLALYQDIWNHSMGYRLDGQFDTEQEAQAQIGLLIVQDMEREDKE